MQFSDEDLLTLSTHGKLKRLIVTNCLNISSAGINYILQRCQLKELTINKCEEVTDDMMFTLSTTQEKLEKISIQSCVSITSKGVSALAWLKNIEKLIEADISRNRSVNDSIVIALYNALQQNCNSIRKRPAHSENIQEKEDRKLTLYVFETSISEDIAQKVSDVMTICFC
ncbi:hypothetical protein WR25_19278 [Diploscapter pachys]|uniref:F-box/LRR-repeat protein 15-like leucin rich repeat domain-containing protein n=1 Tax=Diploscapter pachys TaxID=2018661 RepID=A0A2A2LB23_9BILA|nr:hypothetical protein WR25_19278 [Diploscapter pachys]